MVPSSWKPRARQVRHCARGLCFLCYERIYNQLGMAGLERYEKLQRDGDDVLIVWERLRAQGYRKRDVAAKLGMTFAAFDRATTRARARRRCNTPGPR